jgi:hypothetical protein
MASECERFEIEIGMRQHGALDPKEDEVLNAHLESCAACRQFAAANGGIEAALKHRVATDAAGVDWKKLQNGVHRLQRSYRRKVWLALLLVFQVPLIFLLGLGHLPPTELLAAAPTTVVIYLAYLWLVNRPFREVMAVVKGADDLLLGYVRELRRQVLRARIFVFVNILLSLVCLIAALVEPGTRLRFYWIGCAVVFGGWAAYDLRSKLPRLRSALAEAGR